MEKAQKVEGRVMDTAAGKGKVRTSPLVRRKVGRKADVRQRIIAYRTLKGAYSRLKGTARRDNVD